MGAFSIPIGLGHPDSGDLREVEAVVDTGAIDSMVPASLLEQLHVRASMVHPLCSSRRKRKGVRARHCPDCYRRRRSPLPHSFRQ